MYILFGNSLFLGLTEPRLWSDLTTTAQKSDHENRLGQIHKKRRNVRTDQRTILNKTTFRKRWLLVTTKLFNRRKSPVEIPVAIYTTGPDLPNDLKKNRFLAMRVINLFG